MWGWGVHPCPDGHLENPNSEEGALLGSLYPDIFQNQGVWVAHALNEAPTRGRTVGGPLRFTQEGPQAGLRARRGGLTVPGGAGGAPTLRGSRAHLREEGLSTSNQVLLSTTVWRR